jgi:trans-aconitate methyltransferase
MNIKWNAQEYTDNFKFVHQYGEDVLNLLDVRKGMQILDLGCGNGTLTRKIADMGANVVGMDASKDMLEVARANYPELSFIQADATKFTITEPVDAIFSNAVFHWIDHQDDLLEKVSNALKPNAYLVCEFGGYGNTETIHSALREAFERRSLEYIHGFYFPTIGEYTPILERHQLKPVCANLFNRKTMLVGEEGMMDWINMFAVRPFQNIERTLAEEIKEEVVRNLRPLLYEDDVWYADYVRLRLKAQKVDKIR